MASEKQSDLSDALRQMAEGQSADPPPASIDAEIDAALRAKNDETEVAGELIAAEIDDEAGDAIGQAVESTRRSDQPPGVTRPLTPGSAPGSAPGNTPGTSSALRSRNTPSAPTGTHQLKAFSVPLLIMVGVLLLITGLWAVLVLMGAGVWAAHRPGARTMAAFMLLSWPVGAALIASGIYFYKQVQKHEAELAKQAKLTRSSKR